MAAGESGEGGRARLRLARFLAAGPAELCACAQEGRLLLQTGRKGAAAFARDAVETMAGDGLIFRAGTKVALSPAGAAFLKRADGGEDRFQAQHRDLAEIRVVTETGPQAASVNLAESPLGQLVRRKALRNRKMGIVSPYSIFSHIPYLLPIPSRSAQKSSDPASRRGRAAKGIVDFALQ